MRYSMDRNKVSVIVPVYNQAEFLGDAIQSVLQQTYDNFELIIVNDASTDNTSQIVKGFKDPRIRYLEHEKNKMLPAARNTGIKASSGEIIALLDADDIYHPVKLQKHILYLHENPSVGVTYNPRFVLNHSRNTIRELVRPPLTVTLKDLVLGFPFAPSDMVIRRDWLFEVGLFDETYTNFSEDLDINCRLALAGCGFGSVDKALNYRRYHTGRVFSNIPARLNAAIRALEKAFSDQRCPENVRALRESAFVSHYLVWSFLAFSQGETALGQKYILEACSLDPSMLHGEPCKLINSFIHHSIADENVDHASQLSKILEQLPIQLEKVTQQYVLAVARGYLLKGIRAILWGRTEDGRRYFAQASQIGARIDESILGPLTYQLLSYENEFGPKATSDVMNELVYYLTQLGGPQVRRDLYGNYSFNLAFQNYRAGKYKDVHGDLINAVVCQPKYLANRGMWSILFRSISKQSVF